MPNFNNILKRDAKTATQRTQKRYTNPNPARTKTALSKEVQKKPHPQKV